MPEGGFAPLGTLVRPGRGAAGNWSRTPRVALVHYWLVGMRGGEKVLEELCGMFPGADIFTHVAAPERLSARLRAHRIEETFVGRLPFARRFYQQYLPLMPRALEGLAAYPDFDSYLMRRMGFDTRLSNFDVFGRGWMNRIAKLLEAVSRLNSPQVVEVINDHRDLTTRLLAAVRGTSGPAVTRTRALTDGQGLKLDIA